MTNPFGGRIKYEKRMQKVGRRQGKEPLGRRYKEETERLVREWRSDWTPTQLAAFFKVSPWTVRNWAEQYGLKYRKQIGRSAMESYAIRPTPGGHQITVPRYLVKKLEFKAGDKILFKLMGNRCLLEKERTRKSPGNKPFVNRLRLSRKETSRGNFHDNKLNGRPFSRRARGQAPAGWKSDLTARALAGQFGVSISSVYNWARRYGLTYQPCYRGCKREDLLAAGRSNLTIKELANRLGMSLSNMYYWAHKYDSTWDRWGMLSKRSYALQETGLRGYQIRIPWHIVKGLDLKAGDRLRFGVKNNRCTLSKGK